MQNQTELKSRKLIPAKTNIFWQIEKTMANNIRYTIHLDHKVDATLLQEAFEETMEVWPRLKEAFVEKEDGFLYNEENMHPLVIHNSAVTIAPGAGRNADRVLSVTYYEDTVTLSGLHSSFDGMSVLMLTRGILCRYFQHYYGQKFEVGNLFEAEEGDKEENYEMFLFNEKIMTQSFERKERVALYKDCFHEPKFTFNMNGDLICGRILTDSEQFIRFCKENSASPSIMFAILFAKAVYTLHPETQASVAVNLTRDVRATLGLPMSIAGQSWGTDIGAEKWEYETLPIPELAKKLRNMLNEQRSLDYLLSRADDAVKRVSGSGYIPTLQTLAYMGKIDFGECTQFIKDIDMSYYSCSGLFIADLHGKFQVDVCLGEATADYTSALAKQFTNSGLKAEIVRKDSVVSREIRV